MMKKIGLLVGRKSAYDRAFLRGVAEYARHHEDWQPILLGDVKHLTAEMLKGFSGIIARVNTPEKVAALQAAACPVVDLCTFFADSGFIMIDNDDTAVGELAGEYFLSHHYKHFAYCGYQGMKFSEVREQAFAAKVAGQGRTYSAYEPTPEVAQRVSEAFLQERADVQPDSIELMRWVMSLPKPVAIFCANDFRAYHLSQVCREFRLQVPRQVALLGVDDDKLLCTFAVPSLSSIDIGAFRRGHAASRLLNAALEGPLVSWKGRDKTLTGPGDVVERESTQYYDLDPSWLSDALVFIDKNLYQPFTAVDVFVAAHRSHTLVDRGFKRIFGIPTHKYIVQMKMKAARHLLRTTSMSEFEVAMRMGFSSVQYFQRVYRAYWSKLGMGTPELDDPRKLERSRSESEG